MVNPLGTLAVLIRVQPVKRLRLDRTPPERG